MSSSAASDWIQVDNAPPIVAGGTEYNLTISEDGQPTPFALALDASDPDNGRTDVEFIDNPRTRQCVGDVEYYW